ncbi:MAG: phage portal protein, partial [Arachnia sp.]
AVNFPRLVVEALSERLQLTGFRLGGSETPDADVWRQWQRLGMDELAAQAHTDALVYGHSFVICWADTQGRPQLSVESPLQVAVRRDPGTREVTAALKCWTADGRGRAVLYGPQTIQVLQSKANVPEGGAMPSTGWDILETLANPFGIVPVVPIVNRGRLLDVDGHSEMADVLDLADALNKLMGDMLVTSEYYARPRRWATGLEIVEDDEGNPVKPFSAALDDVWQSEAPETKFGQFQAANLAGYTDAAALITQQIGALTGLPPHYLGLHGDQPASADAIRSAEASLVARCHALQRSFGRAWSTVANLMVATLTGADPATVDAEPVWSSPETRTPAQAADAAAKLVSIGMPLEVALSDVMGWGPGQIKRVRQARRGAVLDTAGTDLAGLLP